MSENELLGLKSKANLNCKICDKCCEYRGDIKITPINVLEIANYLNIPIEEFLEKYTDPVGGEEPEIVLKGVGEKKRCIFNDEETFRCKIHDVEPMQCLVFPLVPWDLNHDLFIHSHQCVLKENQKTSVNRWLNGNHHRYQKNKKIYQEWIAFMEEMQPWWNSLPKEKQIEIERILYQEYHEKKNWEKQVLENIEKAKKLWKMSLS